jgi:hypothetical protein
MMTLSSRDGPSDQSAWDTPKTRQCLRCQDTFHSEWAGERICAHCKSSATWRTSGLVSSGFSTNRR